MIKKPKRNFTRELLDYIYDLGVLVPGIEFPYDYVRRLRRSTYYGALHRLEKQELVVKRKKRRRVIYTITNKGRQLVERKNVIRKRSDGYSTVVVFDIPEEKRRARRAFRKFLLRNGFKPLQKSVYISRNKVPGTIIELSKELDLSSNVSVIGGKVEYYL